MGLVPTQYKCTLAATSPRQAKQTFVLASIEQSVPVLSAKCIGLWYVLSVSWSFSLYVVLPQPLCRWSSSNHDGWPFFRKGPWITVYQAPCIRFSCLSFLNRYLSDPSHLETYESGHAVVVIFSSHAQRQRISFQHLDLHALPACFPKRMVTLYALSQRCPWLTWVFYFVDSIFLSWCISCLHLTVSKPYICLMSSWSLELTISINKDPIDFGIPLHPDNLGTSSWKAQTDNEKGAERLHWLHSTFILTTSLPLALMLRARRNSTINHGISTGWQRLWYIKRTVEALFSELFENMGDREKGAAIRWWYKYGTSRLRGIHTDYLDYEPIVPKTTAKFPARRSARLWCWAFISCCFKK